MALGLEAGVGGPVLFTACGVMEMMEKAAQERRRGWHNQIAGNPWLQAGPT